jgi:alkylated DNA nucleotide flippase Atl1
MSKRPSKRTPAELPWWRIIRLKGTPAAEIGRVQAQDADEAIKIAIEQYEVVPAFRDRLMAYQVRR